MIVCNFFSAFWVFINSFICQKQSYLGWNLLHLSKRTSYTKSERVLTPNLNLITKVKDLESSCQVSQILMLFGKLAALIYKNS